MRSYNFYAGPAVLPEDVIRQASQAALNYEELGQGLSLLEVSHRLKQTAGIVEEAEQRVMSFLKISEDDYKVLFLTGGASTQFFMTAMNLLPHNGSAAYIDTGAWSAKAIKEAALFGKVDVIASSADKNYNYIPKEYHIPAGSSYLHYTSNNTIYGTQFKDLPQTNVPLVCDMSSDIFSKPINGNDYGLIYAGAQKNLGPAGTTLVIVRRDLLGKVERSIPTMLNYQTHIKKDSSFNTPPVFPIYVCLLTLRWLEKNGGIEAMEIQNEKKAKLLYDEIDRNPLFKGTVAVDDRSLMNVNFVMDDEELVEPFIKFCDENRCVGLKGHRSVGGLRASIYNAMPFEGVEVLVSLMQEFESKHGG